MRRLFCSRQEAQLETARSTTRSARLESDVTAEPAVAAHPIGLQLQGENLSRQQLFLVFEGRRASSGTLVSLCIRLVTVTAAISTTLNRLS